MTINLTRRDLFRFGAGAAVGTMLTPAPWKAIDDLAIWTQNWKWIPVPPKGPETARFTACSLCPAGCAVRARLIGGLPVSMHPTENDSIGNGAICPAGLTGHHLSWHPARIKAPARIVRTGGSYRTAPTQLTTIVNEAADAIAQSKRDNTSVAVLDMRPGRSNSSAWTALLGATPNGIYIPSPAREAASLATLASMTETTPQRLGFDLMNAKTIVSFGAPLAEGWGTPKLMRRLLTRDGALRLVQIEPTRSATAEAAKRWLPVRPGTEAVLALGLAHVLISEQLISPDAIRRISDYADYSALVAAFDPKSVSAVTGVPAPQIIETARQMASSAPTLVITGDDAAAGRYGVTTEAAVLGLNLLLGNDNARGGIVAHDEVPDAVQGAATIREIDQVADRSIGLLLVDLSAGDGAIPPALIERKLAKNGRVIALTPFLSGTAKSAHFAIPTAAPLEAATEVTGTADSTFASLSCAAAIAKPREGTVEPIAFVHALARRASLDLAGLPQASEALLDLRLEKIRSAGVGQVRRFDDGSLRPLSDFATAADLRTALLEGARWEGAAGAPAAFTRCSLVTPFPELQSLRPEAPKPTQNLPLTLLVRGSRDVTSTGAVSPALTKIYQESGLRNDASVITINPATARQLRIADGTRVRVQTSTGATFATLRTDERVMPLVIDATIAPDHIALGDGRTAEPGLLDILPGEPRWRSVQASVVEA